jgi:hypothetical protein
MTNLEDVKKTIESTEEIARKIWLAGLGAYEKSVEQVKGSVEKFNHDATQKFENLVTQGEKVESKSKAKFKDKLAVDQRIEDVRNKLGLGSSKTDTKIDTLAEKVEALSSAVSKLS